MKSNLTNFQKKIGINFKNQKLLIKSFTHKSFNPIDNNEKLEFLGDRVLGLIISQNLLKFFPNDKEGDLDKKLASLVNKKQCATIAKNIELQDYIFIKNSSTNTIVENKILSDFYLLTQCKYFIIAPSTFSWWGAWLSKADDKICIRPKKLNNSNNSDFWPDRWMTI